MTMKKALILIISLAVVIACAVSFGVIYYSSENVAIRSVAGVIDDALEREEIAAITEVAKGSSVKFNMTEIVDDADDYSDEDYYIWGEEGESISGKLYISPDALFLKDFKGTLSNCEYDGFSNYKEIELAGELYVSDGLIYAKETEQFDAKIGIELANLKKHLKDSIFAYDSDSDYSFSEFMDEDEYEELLDMLDFDDNTALSKDAKALSEHIIKKTWNIVKANAEFDSEIAEVLVGGRRTTARVITVSIEPEAMKDIVDEFFCEVLANDKKIAKFITTYENTLVKLGLYDTEEYSSFYEYYVEYVEKLRVDTLYDIFEELNDVYYDSLRFEIVTPVISSSLLKFTFGYGYENYYTGEETVEEELVLDLGKGGIKNSADIRFSLGEDLNVRYLISENEKTATAKLFIDGDKVCEYNRNKTNNKFSISVFEEEYDYWYGLYLPTEYKLSGTCAKSNSGYDIKLSKFSIIDEDGDADDYSLDLKLTVTLGDPMPTAPTDYLTIDKLDDEDIEEWIDVVDKIDDLY